MRLLKPVLIWVLLSLTLPVGAVERTGVLAPPEIRKEQEQIMRMLMDGNKFHQEHFIRAAGLPKFMLVCCSDSREDPNIIFHVKPGDIFTIRSFGNTVDKNILGSLEYGADVLHCHVLVVMGHTDCTALKEAIEEHDHPTSVWRSLNLEDLNSHLQPAVEAVTDTSLTPQERWEAVVRANVLNTMETIREESPDLWQLEQDDILKIVGCVYHINTGKVEWLQE